MNFQRQVAHVGGHMDVTRDLNGDEVLAWIASGDPWPQTSCAAGVVKIRLSDAKQTCIWTADWSIAGHVSATDNSGWIFVDSYTSTDLNPPTGWKLYTNEILQIKLDGSEIRRVSHHRSRPLNSYTFQPKVSASRDGSKIVYGSNFGLQSISGYPASYSDAYMIDVAASSAGSTGTSTSGTTTTAPAPAPAPAPEPTPAPDPTTTTSTSTTQTTSATATVTRIQQNGTGATYTGTWSNNSMTAHSGSSATLSMTTGSRASLAFNGTGVSWVAYRDQWSGIAKIYVDGTLKEEVDTYASPAKAQSVMSSVSGLASGNHTLAIEVTGRKNPSSGGTWVWVDAFDITSGGTTTSTTTTGSTSTTSTGSTSTTTTASSGTGSTSTSAPTSG